MAKFKNISKEELSILNHGIVKPGEIVELPDDFHNANFERIRKQPDKQDNKENKHD